MAAPGHEGSPADLEERRRALRRQLDAIYRQIARVEKQLLRIERWRAALAERRRPRG
jgi:hypothetical protein